MKKFIRIPYEEDSRFSYDELKARLDDKIERQNELALYKLKGSPLTLISKEAGDEYTLKYYHSYKKDMCDTSLRFYLVKGLEKSGVKGFFCKPRGIWGVFWGIIATLAVDFMIISYCLLFTADFDLMHALMISGVASVVRAYLCISSLQFNSRRLQEIKLYMKEILDKTNDEGETEENERD